MRLADRQPAHRVARKIQLEELASARPPQIHERRPLHDPELPLPQLAVSLGVLQKMRPRPPSPLRRAFHRCFRKLAWRRSLNAFIQHHRNVRPERELDLRRFLRREQMLRPVQVRAKSHAIIRDFAQLGQAENLVTARIGKNRARPRHELMQAAKLANQFMPRPQI